MRYLLIEAEKTEHRISRLCSVLGVTRQGFYAWRQRGPSQRQLGDDKLKKLIVWLKGSEIPICEQTGARSRVSQ